jgi:predicted phosphate transport protein (TIGR00153 family)
VSGLGKFFAVDNKEFFVLFEAAGNNVLYGAQLLDKFLRHAERPKLMKEIVACEHEGDRLTSQLTDRLNKTFVTPFDREDIYELASDLDDILDFIEEAAHYINLYKIERIRPEAVKQSEVLVKSMKEIATALPKLEGFQDITAHTNEVYELERQGDRLVRDAIAKLFGEEDNPKALMAWKDMFERLEDAIDAAKHTTSVLKGITIRNS